MHACSKNDPVEWRSTLQKWDPVLHASQVRGPPAALCLHPIRAPDCTSALAVFFLKTGFASISDQRKGLGGCEGVVLGGGPVLTQAKKEKVESSHQ